MRIAIVVALLLAASTLALAFPLFRPLPIKPVPAHFECYDLGRGQYVPLDPPARSFGIGLSYAAHIEETASSFDPAAAPPVFEKRGNTAAWNGDDVPVPTTEELMQAADSLEPGIGPSLRADFPDLGPLLDYEGELGFVLLQDVDPAQLRDPSFVPRLGFFVANDLSARSLAILGEGRSNRYEYWGLSKSFHGFMPLANRAWVPEEPKPNGIPCVEIETSVNGEIRQRESTENLIYTPVQMLRFVHSAFPKVPLSAGTVVLTGTPGGVAMKTPRWLVRLGNLVGLSRFTKLSVKLGGDTSRFLGPNDTVMVRGGGLGKVTVHIR